MSQNPPLSVSGDYPNQNYQQPPTIGGAPTYPQHGQGYDNVDNNQQWQQQQQQQQAPARPFNIPDVPLKVIVLVDFLLVIWAAEYPWLPVSYLFGNFMVITMGIWSIIDEKNPDGPHMMLLTLMVTILQDIIMIAVRYGPIAYTLSGPPSEFRFSAGMAILNLILKPLYCALIYPHLIARGGSLSSSFRRKNYESIDGSQPQVTPAVPGTGTPATGLAATSTSPYQDAYSPYSQPHATPTLPQYPGETKSPVA